MLVTAVVVSTLTLGVGAGFAASMAAPYNPPANIAPAPNFLDSGECTGAAGAYKCANPCVTSQLTWPSFTNDVACTDYILRAVNAAIARESAGPMVLPTNWYTLSVPEQLFVLADLERVLRGYPPYLGLNGDLNAEAQSAAENNTDPGLAPGFNAGADAAGDYGTGGAWAEGFNALEADYFWMYDDGWGGSAAATSNFDCTSAGAAACWAHRDELLGSDPGFNPGVGLDCTTCEMGTGYAALSQGSFVDLIELPAGAPPAMTFTWADELSSFPAGSLPATSSTTTTSSTGSATTTTTTTTTTTSTSTSTTSSTSTTTTTTVAKSGGPTNASIIHRVVSANTISVRWLSQGTKGVTRVLLRAYRGAGCKVPLVDWTASYRASSNTSSGVISATKKGAFARAGSYSASVVVRTQGGGAVASRCYALARS